MLIMIPVDLRVALKEAVKRRPVGKRIMREAIVEAIRLWLARETAGSRDSTEAREALLQSALYKK